MAGGLDSLASAAQLASGCHDDPTAHLTPRMLALVAPYSMGGVGQRWQQQQQHGFDIASVSAAASSFGRPAGLWGFDRIDQPPLRHPRLQASTLTAKRASTTDELRDGSKSSREDSVTAQGWGQAPPQKRLQGLPFVSPADVVSNDSVSVLFL